jgi:hypothetical protein
MKLAGKSFDTFRVVNHGLLDGAVDGLLQAGPNICGQDLQILFGTQMSGFM